MKPKLLAIILFILGLGLLGYGYTLPYYTNQTAVDDAEAKYIIKSFGKNLSAAEQAEAKKHYDDAINQHSTAKRQLLDTGSGLAIAGVVLFIFMLVKRVKRFSDFRDLQTFTKIKIFIYANITGLLSFPGTIWYYTYRLRRGDFPSFADSIAIPIMYENTGQVAILVALNVLLVLTLWKAALPSRVFVKAARYSAKPVAWEIFFGLILIVSAFSAISAILDGDHVAVATSLFLFWIFLNLRAGRIGPYAVDGNSI